MSVLLAKHDFSADCFVFDSPAETETRLEQQVEEAAAQVQQSRAAAFCGWALLQTLCMFIFYKSL